MGTKKGGHPSWEAALIQSILRSVIRRPVAILGGVGGELAFVLGDFGSELGGVHRLHLGGNLGEVLLGGGREVGTADHHAHCDLALHEAGLVRFDLDGDGVGCLALGSEGVDAGRGVDGKAGAVRWAALGLVENYKGGGRPCERFFRR